MVKRVAPHPRGSLRARLDEVQDLETVAARPGNAAEEQFQGYASMRVDDQSAVERLLAHVGEPFWALVHVGEQKCELGFRVEVTTSQQAHRYDLRFWGCPEWGGLHRIRQFLARRIAGGADRDILPSLAPHSTPPHRARRTDHSLQTGPRPHGS